MEFSFWDGRWQNQQIGFHLQEVRPGLVEHFPALDKGARVLVPLCGKSQDLLWFVQQGYKVTGVEFVEQAAEAFFTENALSYRREASDQGVRYIAKDLQIEIVVNDIFKFTETGFSALYDRAALVALPESMRPAYVAHLQTLMEDDARVLLVALHYSEDPNSKSPQGPPFSISGDEVEHLWAGSLNEIDREDTRTPDGRYKEAPFEFFDEVTYSR